MNSSDKYTVPDGFREVSKDDFYAFIGKRDIMPFPERLATFWRDQRTQHIVGWSWPGYLREWANGDHAGINENAYAIR